MENKILGAQVIISDYELVNFPLESVKDRIKRELARNLANEIIKSELVSITEEPSFSNPMRLEKRVRAEVVVLKRDEYNELKRKANAAEKAKHILINF